MLLLNTLIMLVVGSSLFAQDTDEYLHGILRARQAKDAELKSRKHSPLQPKDRRKFEGLAYYKVDAQWRKFARFVVLERGDTIDIPTSAGVSKGFYEYALIVFDHEGREDTLMAYMRVWPTPELAARYPPSLFVPFTDLTTGNESYGGGRYLDLPVPGKVDSIIVDFNLGYNPYCAYGGGFSCPVPPANNFLKMRVEAGEKDYASH